MSYTENNFKTSIKKLSNNIKTKLGKKNTKFYEIKNKTVKNPDNENNYNPVNNINNVIIKDLSKLNEKNLEKNSDYKTFTNIKKKNTKFRLKYASISSDTYIIPLLYLIYAYIYVKYNKIEKYSENKKNNILNVDILKIIFSHKNPAIKNVNVFLYNSFNKKNNKNNKLVENKNENKNENTSKLKFLMENSSINDKILNILNKIKIIWNKEEEHINEYIEIILDFLENFVDVLNFFNKIIKEPVPVITKISNIRSINIENNDEFNKLIISLNNLNLTDKNNIKIYNEKLNNLMQLLNKIKLYDTIKLIDENIKKKFYDKFLIECKTFNNNTDSIIIYDKPALDTQFNSINKYNEINGVKRTNIDELIIEFDNKKDLFEKLNLPNINFKNDSYKSELTQINKNILEGNNTTKPFIIGLQYLTDKKYNYDEIFLSIKNIIENENAFLDNKEFKSTNNIIKKYKVDVSGNFRKLEKTKKKDIDEKVKLYEKELKILENQKIKLDALLAKNNKNEISKIDSEISRLNGEIDKLNKYDYNTEFSKLPKYGYQGQRVYTDSRGQQIAVNNVAQYKIEKDKELNLIRNRSIKDKDIKEKEKFEIKQKKDKLAEDKKIIDLQISTYKDRIKKLSINKTNLNNFSKVNNKSDFLNIFDDFINYSDLISKKIDAEQLNKVKDKFYYLLFTKDNLKNLYDISSGNIDKIITNKTKIHSNITISDPHYTSIKNVLNKISKNANNLKYERDIISKYILFYEKIIDLKNKFMIQSSPPTFINKDILDELKTFLIFFNYTVINNINTYFERKSKKDPSIFINSLLDLYQKQNPQNESLVFIDQIKKIDDDLTNKIQSVLNKIYVNLENKKDKLINIDLSTIQKNTLIDTIKESSEKYEKNTNISGKYKKVIPYTDIILAYFLELSYIIDILNHVLYEMYK